MKWLFFLLLIVNLGILGWGMQQQRFTSTPKIELQPELGDLRLLSELETAEPSVTEALSSSETIDAGPAVVPPIEEVESTAVEPVKIEQQPVTAAAIEQEPLPVASEAGPVELPAEEKEIPAPEVQVEVDEEPIEQEPIEQAPGQAIVETSPPPLPAESCGLIGPVDSEPQVRRLSRALARRDIQVEIRQETVQKTVGFWVIIPPYESREKAIEAVGQLKDAGILDVRRFYRGSKRNGISLGMFSRQRNAEKRRREIAAKGFAPQVLPRTRPAEVWMIDYRAPPPVLPPPPRWPPPVWVR